MNIAIPTISLLNDKDPKPFYAMGMNSRQSRFEQCDKNTPHGGEPTYFSKFPSSFFCKILGVAIILMKKRRRLKERRPLGP